MEIVKIINGNHVVINEGSQEGIKRGERFRILGKKGAEIIDPKTKKGLGTLYSIKAYIVADTVYDQMTICTSVPKVENIFAESQSLLTQTTYPELQVDPKEITGGLPSDEEKIRVGDKVERDLGIGSN